MLTHDRDEELSLFLEMRRREKEQRADSLLTGPSLSVYINLCIYLCIYLCLLAMVFEFVLSLLGSDNVSINGTLTTAALSGVSETASSLRYPLRRTAAENFLYSENEKSDYDW